MKSKRRIVRTEEGVEVRLSFLFTHEELEGVDVIKDDPHVGIDGLRIDGGEDQKIDFFLCYLRILCHWVTIWTNRENHWGTINRSIGLRKSREPRQKRRRKRK